MKHTISRARSLVLALRELPARGLWPFTPDPAEPGLRVSGDPPAGTPLLIEGNSRHALDRLQRALGQAGCRVLLIDTGGLDLYTAYRTGRLAVEQILAPLPAADDSTEAPALQSPEEEGVVPSPHRDARALLPYPLWHALGPEQLAAAGVHAGPAHPEELPAFLLGAPLGPDTVRPVPPLRERLHAATAHAGLFLPVAALPLLAVGWEALLVGAGCVLVALVAVVFLLPYLQTLLAKYPWWLPVAVLAGLLGSFVAAGAYAVGMEVWPAAAVAGGMMSVVCWLALNGGRGETNIQYYRTLRLRGA